MIFPRLPQTGPTRVRDGEEVVCELRSSELRRFLSKGSHSLRQAGIWPNSRRGVWRYRRPAQEGMECGLKRNK